MSDAMPDFDNMTPEQINEWMESLAKRQGATEGFTTSASMDVAEVDRSTVDASLLEDTYIPYGWKQEDWQAQLDKEAAQKAAKATTPEPIKAVAPPPAAVAPAPQAAGIAPGITMSEAELTDFIVSLPLDKQLKLLEEMGKQQRGEPNDLADLLPVLDESTVDQSKITKYIPYGWKEEDWDAYLIKEEQTKQTQGMAVLEPPPPVAVSQVTEAVEDFGDVLKAPSLDDLFTGQSAYSESELVATAAIADPAPAMADPMDWLSQLSGGSNASDLPSISFADLNKGLSSIPEPAMANDDPMAWLAGLAASGETEAPLDMNAFGGDLFNLSNLVDDDVPAPVQTDDDQMNWLETLARSHGADTQEFMTSANSVVTRSTGAMVDGPGYQPYSFEENIEVDPIPSREIDNLFAESAVPDVSTFDDPEDWLDSIASNVNPSREEAFVAAPSLDTSEYEDPMTLMKTLNSGGDVSAEAMENFFEAMFQRAQTEPEEPEATAPEEKMPIQAEIPDWLQESFASVTTEDSTNIPVSQLLEDLGLSDSLMAQTSPLIDSPLSVPTSLDWMQDTSDELDPADMGLDEIIDYDFDVTTDGVAIEGAIPDWLLDAEEPSSDMSDIFADANTIPPEYVADPTQFVMDNSDPWVRALAEESVDTAGLQKWYDRSVAKMEGVEVPPTQSHPAVTSTESQVSTSVAGILQPANLPVEDELTQGEPIDVPSWLVGDMAEVIAKVPQSSISTTEEWFDTSPLDSSIPDWLSAQVEDELEPSDALPDWLAGADITTADIPEWLRETVEEEPEVATPAAVQVTPSAPVVAPAVVVQTPAPVPAAPAAIVPQYTPRSPVLVPAAARIDVPTVLQAARTKVAQDIDGSLRDYESVVRANAALPEVVQDLNKLVADKNHKSNPAVHRVLGDALMRQGNLQDALATYRKALNLL